GTRRRGPSTTGSLRTPLGRPDLVGRLHRGARPAREDVATETHRAPQPAGPPRSGVGAAVGSRSSRRSVGAGAQERAATGTRRGPGTERAAGPDARAPGPRPARPGEAGPRRR